MSLPEDPRLADLEQINGTGFGIVIAKALLTLTFGLLLATPSISQTIESSWRATTNSAADDVYHDNDKTLYCGCTYQTHGDSDGSGDVDLSACGMSPLPNYMNRTSHRVQATTAQFISGSHRWVQIESSPRFTPKKGFVDLKKSRMCSAARPTH